MSNNRLPEPFGSEINRNQPINFNFEGKTYQGFAGDNVASALLANGQKIISRSFKYHRPRGILSMTGQDANTLVQLASEANVAADKLLIKDNLQVSGQHYMGSLAKDRLSFIGKLSRFLPVGFYYKAFYSGNSWDKRWQNIFRKFTGLGVINPKNEGAYYDKQYLFYDAVVVGGGVSGLQTALNLAKEKISVLLVDENAKLGGALNYARFDVDGELASRLCQDLVKEINNNKQITVMTDATCNSVYSDNWLSIIQYKRMYKVRAKQLLLATGVFVQPLIFHNNDLPGIMLTTAAQRLMRQYAVKPGSVAVVATVNDDDYATALDLLDAGIEVAGVVDLRDQPSASDFALKVKSRGVKIYNNHTIFSAKANACGTLAGVNIREIINDGECIDTGDDITCDLLCMNGGYMPAYQLPCFLGASLGFDENSNLFVIENLANNCYLVGSVNNADTLTVSKNQASYFATKALLELGIKNNISLTEKDLKPEHNANFVLPIFKHPKTKEFIDYDEDLQICDIVNAVKEGYENIQLVKRFSTLGMGPSQGRFSAFMSAYLVASLDKNRSIGFVGVTTARPPYTVEKIGHQAGRSFFPERHSSMHHRHLQAGAQPLLAGVWIRPAYYGTKDKMAECIKNESLAVHNNVGIVDVSTLGGIEVRGPDAAEFINRMYTWNFLKQPVGKARYALLTNEAGVVIDDGVACRFNDQHFYVTATTGGVDNVYLQFLKWNSMWRLNIDIANVTSAWCGVNVAGPNSRKVLAKICNDVDLSAEAFPYVGVRQGHVAGIQARLIRVGFVGELGYEIHVAQHQGEALWDALLAAGESFGIKPFGIETQRLLRLEKGHVIISQDTDSVTYPEEINMSWAVGNKKPFFIGQKSIKIYNDKKPIRKLIGFEVLDNDAPTPKENHLCFDLNEKLSGRVTSCSHSAILAKTIGMAYVSPEFFEVNTQFQIRCDGGVYAKVKTVAMPFYDPENKRQEM